MGRMGREKDGRDRQAQKGTRGGINRRERKRGGGEVRGDNKTRESDRDTERQKGTHRFPLGRAGSGDAAEERQD